MTAPACALESWELDDEDFFRREYVDIGNARIKHWAAKEEERDEQPSLDLKEKA